MTQQHRPSSSNRSVYGNPSRSASAVVASVVDGKIAQLQMSRLQTIEEVLTTTIKLLSPGEAQAKVIEASGKVPAAKVETSAMHQGMRLLMINSDLHKALETVPEGSIKTLIQTAIEELRGFAKSFEAEQLALVGRRPPV